MDKKILEVCDIQKSYGNKGNITKAVNHISFTVPKGEFIGIMGASGSKVMILLHCMEKSWLHSEERNLDSFFRILICWIL